MATRAGLHTVRRKVSCPCLESNHDSSAVQSVAVPIMLEPFRYPRITVKITSTKKLDSRQVIFAYLHEVLGLRGCECLEAAPSVPSASTSFS